MADTIECPWCYNENVYIIEHDEYPGEQFLDCDECGYYNNYYGQIE